MHPEARLSYAEENKADNLYLGCVQTVLHYSSGSKHLSSAKHLILFFYPKTLQSLILCFLKKYSLIFKELTKPFD